MHRTKYKDNPAYADDIVSSAKPIGLQLVLGAGFLGALLIAMSAIEEPMLHRDSYISRPTENGGRFEGLSWLMCMSGEKPTS